MGLMQSTAASLPTATLPLDNARLLPTRSQFILLVAAYLGLQVAARTFISDATGIDEAHQLVIGQSLKWGYGPHPPLYTWLMILFLKVFGSSTFSLNLLRELLLLGIYVLAYANARWLTRSHACGIIAAVALQFHPTIVWESQRELTNSIVASLMVLATFYAFLRLRPDRWAAWLAFGVCAGLTVLSKYNAAIFSAALVVAAAWLPEFRPLVLNRRMAVAGVLALAVIAPNLLWVATHRDLAFGLVYKFGIHESMSWLKAVEVGLFNWIKNLAAHIAPVVLVFAVVFWRPFFVERSLRLQTPQERLLWRTFLSVSVVPILAVLILKVTDFQDRWLQPLYVGIPVLLVCAVRERLNQERLTALLILGAVVTLIGGAAVSGRLYFTEQRGRRDVLNAPLRDLSVDLKARAEGADFIVTDGYWLAGNLRLRFPHKHVFCPDLAPPDTSAGKRCLVVWDSARKPEPPVALVDFAREFAGEQGQPPPVYVEQRWKYHSAKMMRLGSWVLEKR
jgi:4-amino-4-deoxy-L-arabinose transferase-like glycosyltransferase